MNEKIELAKLHVQAFLAKLASADADWKKPLKYVLNGLLVASILAYGYSIAFNSVQLDNQKKNVLPDMRATYEDVEAKKLDYKKDLGISEEYGSISPRDYVVAMKDRIDEFSKTQSVNIVFGDISFDEKAVAQTSEGPWIPLNFELNYVKYPNIERILEYLRSGKTFFKDSSFSAEYKYDKQYDLATYSLKFEGHVVQFKGGSVEASASGATSGTGTEAEWKN